MSSGAKAEDLPLMACRIPNKNCCKYSLVVAIFLLPLTTPVNPLTEVLPKASRFLCIASGPVTGTYYPLSEFLARDLERKFPQVDVIVRQTAGSYENASLLNDQECSVALMQADVAYVEWIQGAQLTAVAALYTEPVHVASRRELGLERLSDIATTPDTFNINIGPKGSGTSSHASLLLRDLGRRTSKHRIFRLPLTEALERLSTRQLDIIFLTSAAPVPSLQKAAQNHAVSMLDIGIDVVRRVTTISPFLVPTEIPYRHYPGTKRDVTTLGVRTLLVARREVDGEIVTALLQRLFEQDHPARERLQALAGLTPAVASERLPIPIHDAADDYYRELDAWIQPLLTLVRSYALPIAILLVPFLALYRFSKIVYFVNQFVIGRVFVVFGAVWILGSAAMYLVEGQKNSNFSSFGRSTVAILHYLFSGLEQKYPITPLGNVLAVVMLSLGVAMATLLTGTVVAVLVEKAFGIEHLRRKPMIRMSGHLVVLGWSERTKRLLRILRSDDVEQIPIVVVAKNISETRIESRKGLKNIWCVEGRPDDVRALTKADLKWARAAVVMSIGGRETDLENVSVVRTIHRVAPELQIIVETMRRVTIEHLECSDVNEIVVLSDVCEKLITQCIVTPGLMTVYDELLSFKVGSQELYYVPMPPGAAGLDFQEVRKFLEEGAAIPIGYRGDRGQALRLNPKRYDIETLQHKVELLSSEDELVVVADDAKVFGKKTRLGRLFGIGRKEQVLRSTINVKEAEEGRLMGKRRIGICGWNDAARSILAQLRDPVVASHREFEVTIVCDGEGRSFDGEKNGELLKNVSFVFGDRTQRAMLQNAGVGRMDALVVLADRDDVESMRCSDYRALMTVLAAIHVNRDMHIVVEILESKNQEHFVDLPGVEVVSIQDVGEKMMAQAVVSPGITEVFSRLLTASVDSNEIYITSVKGRWEGRNFEDVCRELLEAQEAIIPLGYRVGAEGDGGVLVLNPMLGEGGKRKEGQVGRRDYRLKGRDGLVVLAYEEPS